MIVVIGVAALGEGSGDFSRNFEFKEGESVFAVIVGGTALAFYAMIGFEDSVNVAEETRGQAAPIRARCSPGSRSPGRCTCSSPSPRRTSSRPVNCRVPTRRARGRGAGPSASRPAVRLHRADGVANSALINMIMASRIVYGMADQGIVARVFSRHAAGPAHAGRRDRLHDRDRGRADLDRRPQRAADTTVVLLLSVFTVVNVAVLVLRRE